MIRYVSCVQVIFTLCLVQTLCMPVCLEIMHNVHTTQYLNWRTDPLFQEMMRDPFSPHVVTRLIVLVAVLASLLNSSTSFTTANITAETDQETHPGNVHFGSQIRRAVFFCLSTCSYSESTEPISIKFGFREFASYETNLIALRIRTKQPLIYMKLKSISLGFEDCCLLWRDTVYIARILVMSRINLLRASSVSETPLIVWDYCTI
jgi:hypothetical protein